MKNLMEKVLSLDFDQSELRKRTGNDFLLKVCPYCGRRYKMNINLEKQCFRCPACDESGNAVKMHAKIRGISEEAAREELGTAKVEIKWFTKKEKEIETYSLYVRTLFYYRLLMFGKLEKKHEENLRARGLTCTKNYVSCSTIPSVQTMFEGVRSLLTTYGEQDKIIIKGIPGFYGKTRFDRNECKEDISNIKLNLPKDGFLVPIIANEDGVKRLSCFQIRRDFGETRYIYLTSIGKENGIGVDHCDKVHFTNNFWNLDGHMTNVPKVVNLTEGALKADVAAELSGAPFIAIPGVNAYRDLGKQLDFLKMKGCEQINIYFDMDSFDNPCVEKALKKVTELIKEKGLRTMRVTWDKNFKGIDDFLLSKKVMKKSATK